jgi:hypothetical protein
METELGSIFEEAGLQCHLKVMSSVTKTLSFYKPLPAVPPAVAGQEMVGPVVEAGVAPTTEEAESE